MKRAKQYKRKFYPAWDVLKNTNNKRTRTLRGDWTFEEISDLKAMYWLDVEEELATLLAKEIDAEILRELTNGK